MRDRHGDQSYPAKDLQPPASKAQPLLLPAVVRRLPHGSPDFRDYGIEGVGLVGVIVLSVVVAGLSMAIQSKDLPGKFTQTRMDRETTEVPHGDWAAYSGAVAGQRYSPLAQITPQNVVELEAAWEYHAGDIHVDLPGTAFGKHTAYCERYNIFVYSAERNHCARSGDRQRTLAIQSKSRRPDRQAVDLRDLLRAFLS